MKSTWSPFFCFLKKTGKRDRGDFSFLDRGSTSRTFFLMIKVAANPSNNPLTTYNQIGECFVISLKKKNKIHSVHELFVISLSKRNNIIPFF